MKATPVAEDLAHIAEHHRLHIDRGAPIGGDGVQPAIGDRPLIHPGREHSADRAPQLIARLLREWLTGRLGDLGLIVDDNRAPIRRGQVGVERVALAVLIMFENVLELVIVDVERNVRIHLDKAAIAVIGEALVARRLGQRLDRSVVKPEVEDGVHHARHGGTRPRAHRDQQRIGRIAEDAPRLTFYLRNGRVDLCREIRGISLSVGVEVGTYFRRNREARGDRQTKRGHFV